MNKTVKTIAWICLVLGLLGLAADVGVFVHGRSMVARFQQSVEAGERPALRAPAADSGADDVTKQDDAKNTAPDRDGRFQGGSMMDGRKGSNTFSDQRGGFPGGLRDGRIGRSGFVLPFLFLVSGPVLAVVGAVMLIVNHVPKREDSSEKKEKSKKK